MDEGARRWVGKGVAVTLGTAQTSRVGFPPRQEDEGLVEC